MNKLLLQKTGIPVFSFMSIYFTIDKAKRILSSIIVMMLFSFQIYGQGTVPNGLVPAPQLALDNIPEALGYDIVYALAVAGEGATDSNGNTSEAITRTVDDIPSITVTPWRMNRGGGNISYTVGNNLGDPGAYSVMNIPAEGAAGWGTAPLNSNGAIRFVETSQLPFCRGGVDFTYFETFVDIPANTNVNELNISFQQVDDGARAYIFNSQYPNGAFDGEITINNNVPVSRNYSQFAVAGERNRIVIVQFDSCPTGNNLVNAQVQVNGSPAPVDNTSPPVVVAQNITVALNENGSASIAASSVDNGSFSALAGPVTLSVDRTSFSCNDFGSTVQVTLTATDTNGETSTGLAMVTVQGGLDADLDGVPNSCDLDDDNDGILDADECGTSVFHWSSAPTQSNTTTAAGIINGIEYTYTSTQDFDLTPTVFNHQLFPASFDIPNQAAIRNTNASTNTLTFASPMTNPVLIFASIGGGPISVPIQFQDDVTLLYSNDVVQNSSTRITGTEGHAVVRIEGTFSSITFTYETFENYVNFAFGADFFSLCDFDEDGITNDLDPDSDNDGCSDAVEGTLGFALSQTSGDQLTGAVDTNGVPVLANGGQGVGSSANASANCFCELQLDTTPPVITLTGDVTINHTAFTDYIDSGVTITDECTYTPTTDNPVNGFVLGTYTVTYTATDAVGNVSTATRTVVVQDVTVPSVITQDVTVYLDANGNATIIPADVDNGSTDNSGGTLIYALNQSTFDCDDLGAEQAAEYAVQLDGQNDFINMGSFNDALDNASEATYQVWVNMASLSGSYNSIVEAHESGVGFLSLEYDNVNRKLGVWVTGGNVLTQNSVLNLNEWVNITAVYNGNLPQQDRVKIYLDGVDQPMGNSNVPSSTLTDVGDLIIGSQFGTTQFSNIIYDEVRIWGKALSPAEVQANWNQTIVGDEAGLLGYYAFEDGPGSSTVTELTGNQGLATLNNMDPNTAWVAGADGLSQGSSGVQVTLTVTDEANNSSTATALVTVEDNIAPTVVSHNISVTLTGSGTVSITPQEVLTSGTDNCGPITYTITQDVFGAQDAINSPVTVQLTGTDPSGNATSVDVQVTVIDPVPVVVTQDITVSLDENGNATITPEDIDNGSSSVVGLNGLGLDITSFDCSNVGMPVTVTLTVTSTLGSLATGTAIVTVIDDLAPIVIAENLSINLDETGHASIFVGDFFGGMTAEEIATLEKNYEEVGAESADVEGEEDVEEDFDVPGPSAAFNNFYELMVELSDNCGIVSVVADKTDFDCSNVGDNTVTITVTDGSGNTTIVEALVAVSDVTAPIVVVQNITVELDDQGSVTILPSQLDGGTTDNCSFNLTTSQLTFDCTDLGANTVSLTAIDQGGNSVSMDAVVTVVDVTAPVVTTRSLTIALDDNGQVINLNPLYPLDLDANEPLFVSNSPLYDLISDYEQYADADDGGGDDGGGDDGGFEVPGPSSFAPVKYVDAFSSATYDNCGIASVVWSESIFDCSNIGDNQLTITVTDASGNATTENFTLTIIDNTAPVVLAKNITIALNANGVASITPASIDNGTTDNCSFDLSINRSTFDCNDIGNKAITLTATDASGNTAGKTIIVTVVDNTPPIVVTNNIEAFVNENGQISISASQIDGGSTDNCAIQSLSIDVSSFNCDNLGENSVTLTVTDVNGNSSTGTATVTVIDNIAPEVITKNISVELDQNGQYSIVPEDVVIINPSDIETGESCVVGAAGTHAVWLSQYMPYDGGGGGISEVNTDYDDHTPDGSNMSGDSFRNMLESAASEENRDFAAQDTKFLFQGGAGSLTQNLDGTAEVTGFLVNPQDGTDRWAVTLNLSGGYNWSDWSAMGRDYKDQKNLAGNKYLDWTYYEMAAGSRLVGSGRNQGRTIALSHAPADFKFGFQVGEAANNKNANFGLSGWFFYTNRSGDVVQGDFNLDVTDCSALPPPANAPLSSDNCGIASYELDIDSFDCTNVGENIVQVTATDGSGNATTVSAIVTVSDKIAPTVITQDIVVSLDANGSVTITPEDVDNGSSDNCAITLSLDITTFDCSNVGSQSVVTLTATDESGNYSTGTANVTVVDNTGPIIVVNNVEVQLDELGAASITLADVNNETTDNCGVSTVTIDVDSFDCSNLGPNNVTLTATDINGNISTEIAIVTVVDIIAPIVSTHDISVDLDENGNASITPEDVLILDTSDVVTGEDCTVSAAESHAVWLSNYITSTTTTGGGDCECEGKMQNFTVKYNGTSGVDLKAYDKKFERLVMEKWNIQNGDIITVNGYDFKGRLDSKTNLVIGNNSYEVHTSCSVDILGETFGPFTVISYTDGAGSFCDGGSGISGISDVASHRSGYGNSKKGKKGKKYKKLGDDDDDDDHGDDKVESNNTRFIFTAGGGNLHKNLDGTASVTGTIVNPSDVTDSWIVTLNLTGGYNWSEWSGMGRSYKDEKGLAGDNYLDWTYYEMGEGSNLTGAGRNEGEIVAITHAPTDYRFGFQIGEAANSKNGNFGMSGWFFYTNRAGKMVQGDFNLDVTDCSATLPPEDVVITSDNCSIASTSLDISSFSCGDLGENIVNVTVTDGSGNATTVPVTVTVNDQIGPTAVAHDITVSLGANGTVTVDPKLLDAASTDNCGIVSWTLDKDTFDCDDIVSSYYCSGRSRGHKGHRGNRRKHQQSSRGHKVTLTVTDAAGHTSSASAYITVVDEIAPVISSEPITLVVYGRKKAYLTKKDVAQAVTDNCGVRYISFPRKRYDRRHAGENTVMVNAVDHYGNQTLGAVTVNVVDISKYGRYVTLCYKGKTRRVKRYQIQNWLRHGAVLGSCSSSISEVAGQESEELEEIADDIPNFVPEIRLNSYPNPSAGYTVFTFSSDVDGPGRLAIMNTNGVQLATLFNDDLVANEEVEIGYEAGALPSGIYIVRLVTGGTIKNIKLIVKK